MKYILAIGLICLASSLFSAPYYSERQEGDTTFIFHGNVENNELPFVRKLEAQFMEYKKRRWHFRNELEELGVQIEEIESDDHEPSQLPLEVRKHGLPPGVKG